MRTITDSDTVKDIHQHFATGDFAHDDIFQLVSDRQKKQIGQPDAVHGGNKSRCDAGTQLDAVVIGGVEYRRELITFDVGVYG
jgi:hypothetical protein